jgi:hypothetical protein
LLGETAKEKALVTMWERRAELDGFAAVMEAIRNAAPVSKATRSPGPNETDHYCVVVSGTWWVTSGEKFDPENTVPAPAGSFVRRVAHTPHYDGVKRDGMEPAVIAICGIGPITFHATEAGPGWRKV